MEKEKSNMDDRFLDVITSALAELKDEAFRKYKLSDAEYKRISDCFSELSNNLHSNISEELSGYLNEHEECMLELLSLEHDFNYRQGILHCLKMMEFLGFEICDDAGIAERIAVKMKK